MEFLWCFTNEGFDKLRRRVVLRQSLSPVASRFRPAFPYEKMRSGDIFQLSSLSGLAGKSFANISSAASFGLRHGPTPLLADRAVERVANHRQAGSPRRSDGFSAGDGAPVKGGRMSGMRG